MTAEERHDSGGTSSRRISSRNSTRRSSSMCSSARTNGRSRLTGGLFLLLRIEYLTPPLLDGVVDLADGQHLLDNNYLRLVHLLYVSPR